jgi:PilZ domain
MATPERRRSPRRKVDWPGWYQLQGETTWHVCRFIDISTTGAAIQTPGIALSASPGRSIEVRLDAGNNTQVRVRGEIRNLTHMPDDWVGVGFEFVGIADADFVALLFDTVDARSAIC